MATPKTDARARVRDNLGRMAPEDRRDQSNAICRRLEGLSELDAPVCIAGFWPSDHEPDIRPLLRKWAARGCRILLPVVSQYSRSGLRPRIHLAEFDTEGALVANRWGILEPQGPVVRAAELTAVLVPSVALTAKGFRLGHGWGYYDELLAALPGALRIAPAFRQQVEPELPRESHDLSVDMIVTPDAVIRTDVGA